MTNGPGVYCGVTVNISPYTTGGPFGGFQSALGTGVQTAITISFTSPVVDVGITALDPDFDGNQLAAFDANGVQVASTTFDFDSMPGVYTESSRDVSATAIASVVLTPAPLDYVAYDHIVFTACTAAVPQ